MPVQTQEKEAGGATRQYMDPQEVLERLRASSTPAAQQRLLMKQVPLLVLFHTTNLEFSTPCRAEN
jgi:hypothetical protein